MAQDQSPTGEAVDDATTIFKSVCRSCHGGCGVLLHGRDGRLVQVQGDPESPLNHGRLCQIGTCTADIVNHPDRLAYPRRRIGPRGSGSWERITWDEAFDEISSRLLAIREEFGAEAIAAPGVTIFAGFHVSAMRSARRTGANPVSPSAFIPASTPAS